MTHAGAGRCLLTVRASKSRESGGRLRRFLRLGDWVLRAAWIGHALLLARNFWAIGSSALGGWDGRSSKEKRTR